jgi:Tol biopolymer transport system component
MAHDVFISYSAKNKIAADAACVMLESQGIRCWMAPRDVLPGMEWGECIIDAIEQARIMVLIFSADADASSQIRREVERAVNHGVAILPLRIEDVLPGKALEYFLSNVHWLDAWTPPLEAHLKQLADTIRVLFKRMPARETPKATEPTPQPAEAMRVVPQAVKPAPPAVERKQRRWWPWAVGGTALLLAVGLLYLGLRREHDRSSQPVFTQLTFERGTISSARFTPDGHTIVYGAYWDGKPIQLFSVRPENPESTPVPVPRADILSISNSGEMALSMGRQVIGGAWCPSGTLAQAPLAGGVPRELLDMVQQADWKPDGSALAIVPAESWGGGTRLEYPAGKVLYQTDGWLSHPRFSPQGGMIAFAEHPVKADDKGHISLVDLQGNKRDLTGDYLGGAQGVAWTRSGDEVWYTASDSGTNFELRAVSRHGGLSRLVLRAPGRLTLQDISRDGRVLVTGDTLRPSVMVRRANSDQERDVAWLDLSDVRDLSADGKWVLLTEAGVGSRTEGAYLRKTDGSPGVRIGDGYGYGLSPDGNWALSVVSGPPSQLFLLPTGAGEPRMMPRGKIDVYDGFTGAWFADSRRFVFTGRQGSRRQLYIQDIQGGEPRAISGSEGLDMDVGCSISPDQKYVTAVAVDTDEKARIVPLHGGTPKLVPGVEPGELPADWSADGRSLYIYRPNAATPARVYLVDVASGQRKLWKAIMPADPAGTYGISGLIVTPDGKSYAYSLFRILSDLYVVDGLK